MRDGPLPPAPMPRAFLAAPQSTDGNDGRLAPQKLRPLGPGGVPVERLATAEKTYAFNAIPTRGTPALSAGHRADPYWADLWPYHSSERWFTHQAILRQQAAGYLRPPAQLAGDSSAALAAILGATLDHSPYSINTHVALLGVVNGWSTCTAQQAAALIGDARLRHHLSHPAALCIRANLIDTTAPNEWTTRAADALALYRPATGAAFSQATPDLTSAEWIAITGGQPFGGRGHHDRHNVLATEVGLRAAEYTLAGAVLGEAFSTANLLAGDGAGRKRIDTPARADLTVVRNDGLRIAIELTATTSPHFKRKVEQMVKLLAQSPLEHTGLTVIFLIAPSLELTEGEWETIRRTVYKEILRACRKHPGMGLDPTMARIGVATWREWFPSMHTVSDGFFTLRADRLRPWDSYGRIKDWETADFVDRASVSFTPADPQAVREVITNARALGQSPHWLRTPPSRSTDIPPRLQGLDEAPARSSALPEVHALSVQVRDLLGSMSAESPARQRSMALLHVTAGRLSVADVITQAAQGNHTNPLRKIKLLQLLIAQPRVGPERATKILNRAAAFYGTNDDLTRAQLSWLVHNNMRPRRRAAWDEALRTETTSPSGFPWVRSTA
ncbi:hypothetical protein [Nocardioides zhouii]|uniref:Uncharacterized protein n=1 Tax=Nocardioides zhouii TaxID=1168729 RepID=A0A4Q2SWM5_9ACTN|nr:hypothetical protein [Nocardioides zhouii]RYC10546.1 hypothetical protein EUA94_12165 [Nocardioides zhouii]